MPQQTLTYSLPAARCFPHILVSDKSRLRSHDYLWGGSATLFFGSEGNATTNGTIAISTFLALSRHHPTGERHPGLFGPPSMFQGHTGLPSTQRFVLARPLHRKASREAFQKHTGHSLSRPRNAVAMRSLSQRREKMEASSSENLSLSLEKSDHLWSLATCHSPGHS